MDELSNSLSAGHSIIVCSRCRGGPERPGGRLLSLFQSLGGGVSKQFHLAEADCLAGCGRPLTVAYSAPGKASYLFGDIDPDRDAADLIDFAHLYRSLPDGWCRESERPSGLAGKTIARIPAVVGSGGA